MNLAEFLTWEAEQDRPFEYIDGQPVPISTSTQRRSLLITDILVGLRQRYRDTDYRVLPRMRISLPVIDEVRYPDVIVDAGPLQPDALEPSQPVIVIDVGRERDWSMMPAKYLSVPSDADVDTVLSRVSS
jgi:hypothetical protein